MMKRHKIRWILVLLGGIAPLTGSSILASKKVHSVISSDTLHCKTSLEKFLLRLKKYSAQRGNQAYYEDLYQQTRDFLNTVENLPPTLSRLDKCENFLKVIQDITGSHTIATDLAPMPPYSSSQRGKLTSAALETTAKRPLRQIRYVYDEGAPKQVKEADEEADEAGEFEFLSNPSPRLSGARKSPALEETKEIE
jgi:hypothetical protein